MNRYRIARYALSFIMGAAVGFLTRQAGYGEWAAVGWIIGFIALAMVMARNEVREDRRKFTLRMAEYVSRGMTNHRPRLPNQADD